MAEYKTCRGCVLLGTEFEKDWPNEAINWACPHTFSAFCPGLDAPRCEWYADSEPVFKRTVKRRHKVEELENLVELYRSRLFAVIGDIECGTTPSDQIENIEEFLEKHKHK